MNNAILLVSPVLLFAIFSDGGVKMCYNCEYNCTHPHDLQEETCSIDNESDYLCQAWSSTNESDEPKITTIRKCVLNTEENIQDCKDNNTEGTTCYTCDTDLCNRYIKVEEEERKLQINNGTVKDCYFCEGKCENPLRETTCDENLDPDKANYLCMAAAGLENGTTVHERKCMPNNEQSRRTCQRLNGKKGWGCYICDKNLCNGKKPAIEDEKKDTSTPSDDSTPLDIPTTNISTTEIPIEEAVQMCYFCETGPCDGPEELFYCDDIHNFVCSASVYKRNGKKWHLRQCIPNTREEKYACEIANSRTGESCYTCDSNLCNKQAEKPPPEAGSSTNSTMLPPRKDGAKTCYACTGKCEKPRIQFCEIQNYLCQEWKNTKDSKTVYERKCVPKTKEAREACRHYNKVPGTSCYTCNTDLCNDKYAIDTSDLDNQNTAGTFSPPTMLLAALVSQFITKL